MQRECQAHLASYRQGHGQKGNDRMADGEAEGHTQKGEVAKMTTPAPRISDDFRRPSGQRRRRCEPLSQATFRITAATIRFLAATIQFLAARNRPFALTASTHTSPHTAFPTARKTPKTHKSSDVAARKTQKRIKSAFSEPARRPSFAIGNAVRGF